MYQKEKEAKRVKEEEVAAKQKAEEEKLEVARQRREERYMECAQVWFPRLYGCTHYLFFKTFCACASQNAPVNMQLCSHARVACILSFMHFVGGLLFCVCVCFRVPSFACTYEQHSSHFSIILQAQEKE